MKGNGIEHMGSAWSSSPMVELESQGECQDLESALKYIHIAWILCQARILHLHFAILIALFI